MTVHCPRQTICRLAIGVLACALFASCTSTGGPGSAHDLELQAAAATQRREAERTQVKAVQQADGRVALEMDGWGRPVGTEPATASPSSLAQRPQSAPMQPAAAQAMPAAVQTLPAALPARTAAAPPQPDAVSPDLAIRKMLEDWRQAWMRGDAQAYVKFYDAAFKGNARTRSEWESQRGKRLANGRIELGVSDVSILRTGADEATVRFVQHYTSARHGDNGAKQMRLRRTGNEWKIVAEEWAGVAKAPIPARHKGAKH